MIITLIANVQVTLTLALSSAFTFTFMLITSVGVPSKVRVAGSNDNQAGKGFPLLKVAEYVNVLFPSSSIKVLSGTV